MEIDDILQQPPSVGCWIIDHRANETDIHKIHFVGIHHLRLLGSRVQFRAVQDVSLFQIIHECEQIIFGTFHLHPLVQCLPKGGHTELLRIIII